VVGRQQQVAQVQVHVPEGRGVHVDMDQPRAGDGVPERQPGLLGRLPRGRPPGRLARLQVAARLEPDAHALVPVQDDAARPDHDGRPRDVDGAGEPGERPRQPAQRLQQAQARTTLAHVRRSRQRQHLISDGIHETLLEPHTVVVP
jgi:hypothetical protein